MTSPLCILRAIFYRLRGLNISGHLYQEQPREPGQPVCVQILKCMACSNVSVSWEPCPRCNALSTGAVND